MKNVVWFAVMASFLFLGVACKDKSPAGVCDHAAKIIDDEDVKDKDKCVKEMEGMKKEMGDEKWDKFAGCVLEAENEDGAEKCIKEAMK